MRQSSTELVGLNHLDRVELAAFLAQPFHYRSKGTLAQLVNDRVVRMESLKWWATGQ